MFYTFFLFFKFNIFVFKVYWGCIGCTSWLQSSVNTPKVMYNSINNWNGIYFFQQLKVILSPCNFCHILQFQNCINCINIYYIFHHVFFLEYGPHNQGFFSHNNLKKKKDKSFFCYGHSRTGSSAAVCESAEQRETETFKQKPSKRWDNTGEVVFFKMHDFFLFCCCFWVFVFCLWMIIFAIGWINFVIMVIIFVLHTRHNTTPQLHPAATSSDWSFSRWISESRHNAPLWINTLVAVLSQKCLMRFGKYHADCGLGGLGCKC